MNRNGLRYDIGDSVEIMGKIKTLTAGDASSAQVPLCQKTIQHRWKLDLVAFAKFMPLRYV
eukprot:scaffold5976_cov132-Skeletonema_marinoi.AAC.2